MPNPKENAEKLKIILRPNFRARMNAIIQNIFEINYSQLIKYEILEKLVT